MHHAHRPEMVNLTVKYHEWVQLQPTPLPLSQPRFSPVSYDTYIPLIYAKISFCPAPAYLATFPLISSLWGLRYRSKQAIALYTFDLFSGWTFTLTSPEEIVVSVKANKIFVSPIALGVKLHHRIETGNLDWARLM